MGILWISLVALFSLLEAVTAQFICIWFAGGAVFALIAHLLGAAESVQSIVFVLASALLLVLTRPFVREMTKNAREKTKINSVVGKNAIITKTTDNTEGEAKIDGKYWSARSEDGLPIEKDSVVTVEKIEGVKLIVKR